MTRPHHRAVDRIAAILEAVVTEPEGLSLTKLALRLDAPVSSIQKLVNGLAAVGYLDEQDHRFRLGAGAYVLALRSGLVPVQSITHGYLEELHQRSGVSAVLAIRTGDTSVYVDWAGTDDPFNYLSVQQLRTPLPETAVGRVLLAHLPERERYAVVSAVHPGDAGAALTLLADLERLRANGYTMGDSGPMLRGIAAVAMPVWERGSVVAAVALAGPHENVDGRLDELAKLLGDALAQWAPRSVD
ncbi:IclR family transcriptional regulator [Kutzneria viridogrisea]|uniref:IclR family transcription regulator n=2 Tax=Kutzneria TaxID=43356 RepID=W5W589_9PSEU|nr:IclR family transcriptional regulator C-terminal domain-containing protein [Kutzneria albida]AHH96062.1 hypothetical protein KALB_2694 [Kutzneria albida DSM 43870]MBA8928732.1 DNA-binding IclR family transcriptional regulator [Kutzneria viridogrisea]